MTLKGCFFVPDHPAQWMELCKNAMAHRQKAPLSLQLADVPEEVVEYGTLLLTDALDVAVSCQNMKHAAAVKRAVEAMGSAPKATPPSPPTPTPCGSSS